MPHFRARVARVDIGVEQTIEGHRDERAATIATTIHSRRVDKPSRVKAFSRQASSAPVSAKGSAKTECSNLIISSVRRILWRKVDNQLLF